MIPGVPELAPWLAGIAWSVAVAASPWGALLGLAVAGRVPGLPELPGDLAAFAAPWIVLPAGVLLLLELAIRSKDGAWLVWEAVHVPVRLLVPPALLLLAANGSAAPGVAWGPAALAAAVAASLVALRWGSVLSAEARGIRPLQRTGVGAAGLALTALALAAVGAILPAMGAAAALLLVALAWLHDHEAVSAGLFAPRLLAELARFPVEGGGWRPARRLARWVRRDLSGGEGDSSRRDATNETIGTAALLCGAEPPRRVRAGWLVVAGGRPFFLFRSPTRVWSIPLARAALAPPGPDTPGRLLRRTGLTLGGERVVLATSRCGPTADALADAFPDPPESPIL